DIHSSGSITVLYSGYTANGLDNSQIIQGMLHNGDDIRVIDTTEAARFLNVDPTTPNWNKPLYQKLEQIIGGKPDKWGTPANQFLFGEKAADGTRLPNGAWDTISARFVNETVGEVRTLTGGASVNGVFNQTELPRLLNNPNITSVDGLPIADLRRLGAVGSFQAISAQSEHLSGYLKLAINADGSIMKLSGGIPSVDSQQYFALTGLEGKPPLGDAGRYDNLARYIPARLDTHLEGARLVQDIKDGYQRTTQLLGPESAAARADALRVLGKLGVAADLLSLAVMAHDANAAYASGNIEGSRQIVQDWTSQYLGGLMGGLAEAKAVGLLLTPVYLDGPIGAAVASVLTVAAGVEGTFLGSHYIGAFLDKVFDQLHHIGELSGARLYDWVTQIGDLFRRLNQTLHTDNASLLDLLHDLFRHSRDVRDPLVLDLDGDGITHASGWVKSDDGLLVLDRNGNGRIDNGSELFGADTVLSNGHTAASGFDALRDLDSNGDGLFSAADARFTDVRVWRDLNQDGQSQANELFTLSTLGIASITLTPTDTQRVNLGNGNVMDARGSYTRTDGRSGTVGNLQLGVDQFYRDYRGAHDKVTINDAARALPAISGSGAVRDLQEAASLSPALLVAVQALLSGTTQGTLRAALDQVIALWASTSTMLSTEERLKASADVERTVYYQGFVPPEVTAQGKEAVLAFQQQQRTRLGPMIGILEKFNGSRLISDQNDHILGAPILSWNRVVHPDGHKEDVITITLIPEQLYSGFDPLTDAYAKLKESIYIRLVLEPRLNDYLSGLTLTYNNGVMGWDASGLEAKLDQTWQHNKAQALQDVMDLQRYGRDALAPSGWNPLDALCQMVYRTAATPDGRQALADAGIPLIAGNAEGSAAMDLLFGDAGANLLRGGGGDDVLSGGDGDDVLDGGEGSNRLEGGAGHDVLNVANGWNNVLNGGSGDDLLYGSFFADTYLFNKGDGRDTLIEQGGADKLVFGAGIIASQVRLLHEGQDVVLDLGNGHDSIRMKDWLTSDGEYNRTGNIEEILFADGTRWTGDTLGWREMTTFGTSGNDTLQGWGSSDILLGGNGDDVLSGDYGDDTLYGEAGDDLLLGDNGNDVLDGGEGHNRLEGGAGKDVLKVSTDGSSDNVFSGGTGDDMLYGSVHSDTYLFNRGDGRDTIVEQGGFDKIVFGEEIAVSDIHVLREGQDVVLDLYNGYDSIRLKDWLTSDGTRNSNADIEQIVFADGTVWSGETLSSIGLKTLGSADNDTLNGWNGRNILVGEDGDDVLKVSMFDSSDNVLVGCRGNDMLYGSSNSDTYFFDQGDGHDTIIEQGGADTLEFGEGLHREEACFTRSGDDLSILFNGSEDQVTVAGWFSEAAHQVESLVFQDGTVLSGEVERLIEAMALSPTVTTMQASVRDIKESPRLVASSIV
ncbi:calcium-binding protein, partial [Xylella fastidiosa]|uniref:calcium-binding protein n=1 Tax=Xylella fastidiosa TaxID=2371 RepID=UPI00091D46CA